MDPDALAKMVSSGTASVAAYEFYLEGLALDFNSSETGNIADWGKAKDAYDRAVELDPTFALAHWKIATYWATQFSITQIGSELSELSLEEDFANYTAAIDTAIEHEQNEALALKFKASKAFNEFRFSDSQRYLESYVKEYPNDVEGLSQLISLFSNSMDKERARPYVNRNIEIARDDAYEINGLLNNMLFLGLVDETVSLARESIVRFPQHAFILYQSHRVLLWAGFTEEAAALVEPIRRSEFPIENIKLVQMRQACAEGDRASAELYLEQALAAYTQDESIGYIGRQILGRPADAHQLLIDADIDNWAVASFLTYPYFDHTLFPEMASILEQQGIDRRFISGPPYACQPDQS
jgi:tetratricopeptide (TPR) repeat protein